MKAAQIMRPTDATAEGYEGPRLWNVMWNNRIPATVAAPTPEAAMVTAARFWGVRWQAPDFYEKARIVPV